MENQAGRIRGCSFDGRDVVPGLMRNVRLRRKQAATLTGELKRAIPGLGLGNVFDHVTALIDPTAKPFQRESAANQDIDLFGNLERFPSYAIYNACRSIHPMLLTPSCMRYIA